MKAHQRTFLVSLYVIQALVLVELIKPRCSPALVRCNEIRT